MTMAGGAGSGRECGRGGRRWLWPRVRARRAVLAPAAGFCCSNIGCSMGSKSQRRGQHGLCRCPPPVRCVVFACRPHVLPRPPRLSHGWTSAERSCGVCPVPSVAGSLLSSCTAAGRGCLLTSAARVLLCCCINLAAFTSPVCAAAVPEKWRFGTLSWPTQLGCPRSKACGARCPGTDLAGIPLERRSSCVEPAPIAPVRSLPLCRPRHECPHRRARRGWCRHARATCHV